MNHDDKIAAAEAEANLILDGFGERHTPPGVALTAVLMAHGSVIANVAAAMAEATGKPAREYRDRYVKAGVEALMALVDDDEADGG